MQYKNHLRRLSAPLLILLFVSVFTGCEENVVEPTSFTPDPDGSTIARAIYSSRTVNFDNRSDGTYTSSEAYADFGNVSGWNDSRAYNSGGTCRIAVLANALGSGSGMLSQIDVSDGDEYELKFSIKFHSAFEWSRGGKTGFGFYIGDGNTGCDRADDGLGGSARVMWYTNNDGRTYLKPYVYYRDMPSTCGNDFGKSYPSSGSISRSTWYNVVLYMKSNTGTSTNGYVRYTINGTTILGQSIRWTTDDSKRLMRRIFFHTFRGGSESHWEASTNSYIYYDNVSWNRISS